MAAEPINLNKARKARKQAEDKASAARNRVRFGRSKAEKALQAAMNDKRAGDLDGHEREP